MCRLDGTVRTKEERQEIIDRFTSDTSYTSFLLTTQVHDVILTARDTTLCSALTLLYTVNHKKGGSTFVVVTLEKLDGF